MAIDWNAIYADQLSKIADPTDAINTEKTNALTSLTKNWDDAITLLKGMQTGDETALGETKTAQEAKFREKLEDALRQGYISREMNKKDLPALMSNMGLTGGVTETAAGDLLRDYRNSSNASNKSFDSAVADLRTQFQADMAALKSMYSGKIGDITNTYNTNYSTTDSGYQQQLRDALDARNQNATTNTNNRYAQLVAEEQAEWERRQAAAAAPRNNQIIVTDNNNAPASTSPSINKNPPANGNPYTIAGYAGAGNAKAQSDALDDSKARQGKQKVVTQYGTFYR